MAAPIRTTLQAVGHSTAAPNGYRRSKSATLTPTVDSGESGTSATATDATDPVEFFHTKQTTMTRYTVYVPSDTYASESTHDLDRAWDLCLSLSEEYGYAQGRRDGVIIGDYTDGGA